MSFAGDTAEFKNRTVSVPVWQPAVVRKKRDGGIAQLGERLHGMQEVSGSIPLTSTISGGAKLVKKLFCRCSLSPLRLEA